MDILFWIFLFLITFTYLIYPAIIIFMSLFVSSPPKLPISEYPTVAMVVPAFNEEDHLHEKINNCLTIDYPQDRIEFIFGSDGSDDGTNDILESKSNRSIRAFIYPKREGKTKVLNKLIGMTQAEIILLSDANTIYQPESVKILVRHFSDNAIGGVCGKLRLINPSCTSGGTGESLYWRYENLIKEAEGKISSVISANGAIFAIRRALFEPLQEDIIVNDDFANTLNILRKNKRVIYEPQAIATENTSPNMGNELIRRIRISALNFNAMPELIRFLRPKYGFPALALFSHKILRWLVPFFGFGILISNFLILGQGGLYPYLFAGQVLIYLASLLGYLGEKFFNRAGIFLPFYYLVLMNIALVIGLWLSITGTQKHAWERVSR